MEGHGITPQAMIVYPSELKEVVLNKPKKKIKIMIKTISLPKLKKQYIFVCNEYINKFINKQGYEFSGWVGDDFGGVACFIEQFFFSLDDIVFDINNGCEKGLIFAWQEHNLEVGLDKAINYYSYSRGLRMTK